MAAQLSITEFLGRLRSVTAHGDNWQAQCPAHEDRTASLSVSVGREGRILLKCFAGCEFRNIVEALNLTPAELLPTRPSSTGKQLVKTYPYRDLDGTVLFEVCRYENPKTFRPRSPLPDGTWDYHLPRTVKRVPYRLNELQGHATVYIVEGEKDADTLWSQGAAATTNVGGAGKWRTSDSLALERLGVAKAFLIPDNDAPGRKHMDDVAKSLRECGITVVLVGLEDIGIKGDVSEWFARGHSMDELDARAKKTLHVVPSGGTLTLAGDPDPAHAGSWPRTDLGSAEAFVARDGHRIRFDHKQDRWLIWNCHHWAPDVDERIHRIAHEHVRQWQQDAIKVTDREQKKTILEYTMKLERSAALEIMIKIARALLPVADTGLRWDERPMLIGCPNGVIDLVSGQFREGHQDDLVTMQTAAPFQVEAQCPIWEQFLSEIFDDNREVIDFIQRAIGYSLTGDMSEQCFFLCVGAGSNGKSTFLSTLSHVWGDYGYQTDTRVWAPNAGSTDTTLFDLAELAHRRLIIGSETKANSRMNEQALKTFTGGEKINAQRKFGHPFEFMPVGKVWMGLNHQPRVFDDSFGFWRRVRLIPFTRTFAGSAEKRNLKHQLRAEASGILNWALQGCLTWQARGLEAPDSVMTATDAYQEAEDPLREFINERVESEFGAEATCVSV